MWGIEKFIWNHMEFKVRAKENLSLKNGDSLMIKKFFFWLITTTKARLSINLFYLSYSLFSIEIVITILEKFNKSLK